MGRESEWARAEELDNPRKTTDQAGNVVALAEIGRDEEAAGDITMDNTTKLASSFRHRRIRRDISDNRASYNALARALFSTLEHPRPRTHAHPRPVLLHINVFHLLVPPNAEPAMRILKRPSPSSTPTPAPAPSTAEALKEKEARWSGYSGLARMILRVVW
ncbi:hypothetical protein C8R45DRAFT_1106136 [Mycena sanguinolenta]|nr:hypothetical protein C8R45DRAFT_1106136 [Mycena sanguinolenta]